MRALLPSIVAVGVWLLAARLVTRQAETPRRRRPVPLVCLN